MAKKRYSLPKIEVFDKKKTLQAFHIVHFILATCNQGFAPWRSQNPLHITQYRFLATHSFTQRIKSSMHIYITLRCFLICKLNTLNICKLQMELFIILLFLFRSLF